MTIAHSTLTGSDLHESKGVSTATAGQVAIANGSGGAPFGLLTASSLTGTGNPFGAQLLHVREEQSSGVSGTSSNGNAGFTTQVLNTVKTNEISGASLAGNQITLPAGTYFAYGIQITQFSFAAAYTIKSVVKLRNITASSDLLIGHGLYMQISTGQATTQAWPQMIQGRFTLSGTSAIAMQMSGSNTLSNPNALGLGVTEVYNELFIWKVA